MIDDGTISEETADSIAPTVAAEMELNLREEPSLENKCLFFEHFYMALDQGAVFEEKFSN